MNFMPPLEGELYLALTYTNTKCLKNNWHVVPQGLHGYPHNKVLRPPTMVGSTLAVYQYDSKTNQTRVILFFNKTSPPTPKQNFGAPWMRSISNHTLMFTNKWKNRNQGNKNKKTSTTLNGLWSLLGRPASYPMGWNYSNLTYSQVPSRSASQVPPLPKHLWPCSQATRRSPLLALASQPFLIFCIRLRSTPLRGLTPGKQRPRWTVVPIYTCVGQPSRTTINPNCAR